MDQLASLIEDPIPWWMWVRAQILGHRDWRAAVLELPLQVVKPVSTPPTPFTGEVLMASDVLSAVDWLSVLTSLGGVSAHCRTAVAHHTAGWNGERARRCERGRPDTIRRIGPNSGVIGCRNRMNLNPAKDSLAVRFHSLAVVFKRTFLAMAVCR